MKPPGFYINYIKLRLFLKKLDVKLVYFIPVLMLSFGAACLEGVSLGILAPLAKGIIDGNFNFLNTLPIFKQLISIFPNLFSATNTSTFILLLSIIFFATALKHVFQYISSLIMSYQTGQFQSNMRKYVFQRYLKFGKLFFDRSNIGYLSSVLMGFTSQVAGLLGNFIRISRTFFMLFVYFTIMIVINWKLTIASLIAFPILHYAVNWIVAKIKKTSQFQAKIAIRFSKQLTNTLMCIPLVKTYSREGKEKEKFNELSDLTWELQYSMAKKNGLIAPIKEIVQLSILLFLISLIALFVMKEKAGDVTNYLVFFLVIRRAMPLFNILNETRIALARTSGPLAELLEVLNDKDKYYVVGGEDVFTGLKRDIEIKNMNFSYIEGIPILKDLNIVFKKNTMTALVGSTGAGKTTIINLISRLYECDPGSILLDGKDIRDFTLKSILHHIAMVSQDVYLFNDTFRMNLTYGLDRKVSQKELTDVIKNSQLRGLMSQLPDGLDSLIGDRGVRLSGGEKQRLSIARAFLKKSEILILDEATSSLDSKTEKLIQRALDNLIKDRTTIVIAHRLSTVKHTDKIVVIEGGRLVEEGKLDELLQKKGKFYEYWEEQKFY